MKKKALIVAVTALILAGGVAAAFGAFRLGPPPALAEPEEHLAAVEVALVHFAEERSLVTATGVVQPDNEVVVMPEVSGRLVAVADALEPGGRLEQGDVVARIDARDYRLALRQEQARVRSTELELLTETGRGEVARREWAVLGDGRPDSEATLALRAPHLETARANVDSAQSGLERARLSLGRTTIRAPWNALVIEATAATGQVVSPSSRLATIIGSDRFRVRVSLPADRLAGLDVPGVNAEEGAEATVIQQLGGRAVRRPAKVSRLEGQLDPETRMARLLLTVDRPLDEPEGAVPLLPGTYVTVEIEGRPSPRAARLPPSAVHDGNLLWVVDASDRLSRHSVDIAWQSSDAVFVTSGLEEGARVVRSPLSRPIEGARVRVVRTQDPESSGSGGAS